MHQITYGNKEKEVEMGGVARYSSSLLFVFFFRTGWALTSSPSESSRTRARSTHIYSSRFPLPSLVPTLFSTEFVSQCRAHPTDALFPYTFCNRVHCFASCFLGPRRRLESVTFTLGVGWLRRVESRVSVFFLFHFSFRNGSAGAF